MKYAPEYNIIKLISKFMNPKVYKSAPDLGRNNFPLKQKPPSSNKSELLFPVILIALVSIGAIFYYIKQNPRKPAETPPIEKPKKEVVAVLPVIDPPPIDTNTSTRRTNLSPEDMMFGDFYEKPKEKGEYKFKELKLPINVKSDSINYYDISRKLSIAGVSSALNKNGFAIIKNPYGKNTDDFFTNFAKLRENGIPVFVSTDFLLYYYDIILKGVYKNIEKDTFYTNVWNSTKILFNNAHLRYISFRAKYQKTNPLIVEAQRQEAAYLAVILELLKPEKEQIMTLDSIKESDKFTIAESEKFRFELPSYLKDDVLKEVSLIKNAKLKTKSPILRYEMNYKEFLPPDNYKQTAKLINFFEASRWMNSLFPLHYKSETCENCLLDKEDWKVSMLCALFLSSDIANAKDIKSQWAKIYKVIAFFSGLRNDLTYLNYSNTLNSINKDQASLETVFSKSAENSEKVLIDVQKALAVIKFQKLEAGVERDSAENMPSIGWKLLQDSYWPNQYIMGKLVDPATGLYAHGSLIARKDLNTTSCSNRKKGFIRCKPSAFDLVYISYPNILENEYFKENSSYDKYQKQVDLIRKEITNFNVNTWHSSVYWSYLSLGDELIRKSLPDFPAFMKNQAWKDKTINTLIGSWVNGQLPGDDISLALEPTSKLVGSGPGGSDYYLIEPNLEFIKDLRANVNMVLNLLVQLDIISGNTAAKEELVSFERDLQNIETMVKKEMAGEMLNSYDIESLISIIGSHAINKKGLKSLYVNAVLGKSYKGSIDNIGIVIVAHKYGDGKVALSAGPVFEYSENKGTSD